MPIKTKGESVDGRTAAAALAIVAFAAIVVAPHAFWGGVLTSDGYEHLGIAHAWVHGAGFVDPVQWHYYLTQSPPLPATAVRPPLISLLAALPLAAGATLPTIIVLHGVWSAWIIGALFLVASRFMRRRAAATIALLVVTFPPWTTYLAVTPLSEVTAVGCYLLVLVTAGGVVKSPRGAAICAAATLLAAMARPNLSALLVAVSVAVIAELGPRAALRNRSLWTYVSMFSLGYLAIQIGVEATTGIGLYAGYGVVNEMLGLEDIWRYDREFEGAWAFVNEHAEEITLRMRERIGQLFQTLFIGPGFHRIGWLLAPAVLYGLFRQRDGVLAHRINAFATLGFAFILIVNYSAFDPDRYPLWLALPLCLGGIGFLDALALYLESHLGTDDSTEAPSLGLRVARGLGWLPMAVACLVAVGTLHTATGKFAGSWSHYQAARDGQALGTRAPALLSICEHIDPDAVVASANPWQVLYWCGNAGLRIPIRPLSDEVRDRFVSERNARYILLAPPRLYSPLDMAAWVESLDHSSAFRKRATIAPFVLYESVGETPKAPAWKAPPPLVCAGLPADCTRRSRRQSNSPVVVPIPSAMSWPSREARNVETHEPSKRREFDRRSRSRSRSLR